MMANPLPETSAARNPTPHPRRSSLSPSPPLTASKSTMTQPVSRPTTSGTVAAQRVAVDERTGILGGHNSPKRRAREKTLHLMRMIEDRRRRSGPDIEDTDEHLLTYAELAALRDGWPKGRRRADQYEGPLKIKATR